MLQAEFKLKRAAFSLDVSLRQDTSVLGIFGHSGAGKSTLLHAIAGLERPDWGRIVIDEEVVFDSESRTNVRPFSRRIGLMFQDDRLFPHLSVERNLRYGERFVPVAKRQFEFRHVVDSLRLERLLDRGVPTLSGGERQRVALGRALLCSPRLLMFDEPLSSLDLNLKLDILPFLREAQRRFPIPALYVSHDLTELLQLTDELMVLRDGRIIDQGRYLTIARNTHVIDAIHREGLINVLDARVEDHDSSAGITRLSLATRSDQPSTHSALEDLCVPLQTSPVGTIVQAVIRPEDVSLATARIHGISIQNQRQGTVIACTIHGGSVVVEIDVGQHLLALVSKRAVESMALTPGTTVWCLIKSSAIQVR